MNERRQKELSDFQNKVVVGNTHFFVNTKMHQGNQQDKYRGMLQGKATKVGLRLGQNRLTQMAGRHISASRSLKDLPVSSLMKEPYIMNENSMKPIKTKLDLSKTPYNPKTGQSAVGDFNRFSGSNMLSKNPASKVRIRPMTIIEKVGPKYGKVM